MREPEYGGLAIKTLGARAAAQRTEMAGVDDETLARELAGRGYDVRMVVPNSDALAKRVEKHEKRKAQQEANDAHGPEGRRQGDG